MPPPPVPKGGEPSAAQVPSGSRHTLEPMLNPRRANCSGAHRMDGDMAEEQEFETETMAGIYANQGHYGKAIEIYRRLLEQDPDRMDLKDKLLRIESKKKYEDENRLADKISEWLDLLMKQKKLQALKQFKKSR